MNFESRIVEVLERIQKKAEELDQKNQLTLQEADFLNFLNSLEEAIADAFETII